MIQLWAFLDRKDLFTVLYALVASRLHYCNVLCKNIWKLQSVQNATACMLTRTLEGVIGTVSLQSSLLPSLSDPDFLLGSTECVGFNLYNCIWLGDSILEGSPSPVWTNNPHWSYLEGLLWIYRQLKLHGCQHQKGPDKTETPSLGKFGYLSPCIIFLPAASEAFFVFISCIICNFYWPSSLWFCYLCLHIGIFLWNYLNVLYIIYVCTFNILSIVIFTTLGTLLTGNAAHKYFKQKL